MGFCQKPLDLPYPAGRFNHACWLLAQADLNRLLPPCRVCHIREIAGHALAAGASIHLMTSAVDLAHDLLLPGLREKPWKGVILSVCPFSVGPISLAMEVCGLRGVVLPYDHGDCRDYAAWLRADETDKPERTFLPVTRHQRLLTLLDQATRAGRKGTASPAPLSRNGELLRSGRPGRRPREERLTARYRCARFRALAR